MPLLVDQDYALLPGAEALRHADRLYATLGVEGRVFARPDGVWKTFTGSVIRRAAFEGALAPARHDPSALDAR